MYYSESKTIKVIIMYLIWALLVRVLIYPFHPADLYFVGNVEGEFSDCWWEQLDTGPSFSTFEYQNCIISSTFVMISLK